jgi:hypothetical protein
MLISHQSHSADSPERKAEIWGQKNEIFLIFLPPFFCQSSFFEPHTGMIR